MCQFSNEAFAKSQGICTATALLHKFDCMAEYDAKRDNCIDRDQHLMRSCHDMFQIIDSQTYFVKRHHSQHFVFAQIQNDAEQSLSWRCQLYVVVAITVRIGNIRNVIILAVISITVLIYWRSFELL